MEPPGGEDRPQHARDRHGASARLRLRFHEPAGTRIPGAADADDPGVEVDALLPPFERERLAAAKTGVEGDRVEGTETPLLGQLVDQLGSLAGGCDAVALPADAGEFKIGARIQGGVAAADRPPAPSAGRTRSRIGSEKGRTALGL